MLLDAAACKNPPARLNEKILHTSSSSLALVFLVSFFFFFFAISFFNSLIYPVVHCLPLTHSVSHLAHEYRDRDRDRECKRY